MGMQDESSLVKDSLYREILVISFNKIVLPDLADKSCNSNFLFGFIFCKVSASFKIFLFNLL